MNKKAKPNFLQLNYGTVKRVKRSWRKPRGVDNKKRIRKAWAGAVPRVGYRNPVSLRNIHPSGLKEILVNNVAELSLAKGKAVRIATGVGAKKRAQIISKAKEMKLNVLNA